MRSTVRFVRTTLMALAVDGLVLLTGLPYLGPLLAPPAPVATPTPAPTPVDTPVPLPATQIVPVSTREPAATRTATPRPTATPTPVPQPMTLIKVDSSVPIDAEVVVSPLVKKDGGVTWEVPSFKVGHAQFMAQAGEVGNAVLLGHVTSRGLGNVFQQLERVRVGDPVEIFTATSHMRTRSCRP